MKFFRGWGTPQKTPKVLMNTGKSTVRVMEMYRIRRLFNKRREGSFHIFGLGEGGSARSRGV